MRCLAGNFGGVLRKGFTPARGSDYRINEAPFKFVPHRRHSPELDRNLGKRLDGIIHVFNGVHLTERHDNVALGEGVIEANGCEHVGNF